jgi:hypothetical protein
MIAADAALPTQARCLSTGEVTEAKTVYGDSLHYHKIYISDGSGGGNRPCTVAIPFDGDWIVLLNCGRSLYLNPGTQLGTLIHELAHAWQSQHHKDPWQYMVNCLGSQLAAEVATKTSNPHVNMGIEFITKVQMPITGPADAYSYVPGKPFGSYGGEQIAQQVEDNYSNYPEVPARYKPLADGRRKVASIGAYMKTVPAGRIDPLNTQSLSKLRFGLEMDRDIVWHT